MRNIGLLSKEPFKPGPYIGHVLRQEQDVHVPIIYGQWFTDAWPKCSTAFIVSPPFAQEVFDFSFDLVGPFFVLKPLGGRMRNSLIFDACCDVRRSSFLSHQET